MAQPIPYLQTLQQATPSPDNVLASNIISLQLQYWDPTQQNWRDSWDFEQPNLPPSATAATTLNLPIASDTTATANGAGSADSVGRRSQCHGNIGRNGKRGRREQAATAASSSNSASTGSSDLNLPSAVQITLVIRKRDGTPGTYTTILPIVAPALQNYPYVGGQTVNPVTAAAAERANHAVNKRAEHVFTAIRNRAGALRMNVVPSLSTPAFYTAKRLHGKTYGRAT